MSSYDARWDATDTDGLDLQGEYDSSAGFWEYIYVKSQVAAKVADDTTVIGQYRSGRNLKDYALIRT